VPLSLFIFPQKNNVVQTKPSTKIWTNFKNLFLIKLLLNHSDFDPKRMVEILHHNSCHPFNIRRHGPYNNICILRYVNYKSNKCNGKHEEKQMICHINKEQSSLRDGQLINPSRIYGTYDWIWFQILTSFWKADKIKCFVGMKAAKRTEMICSTLGV
jgi:hypothetical protein